MQTEVWVVWPTVNLRQSRRMTRIWQGQGYSVAVYVDKPQGAGLIGADKILVGGEWKGFPRAMNRLCREVPGDVVACVGDDIFPDPNRSAQSIRELFLDRFPGSFGVMQPTGDDFGWTHKAAVSPWIGREFIEKAYGGKGPWWEEYFHYFSDQELQEYASKLGVFQQHSEITQFHDHWQRKEDGKRPDYLLPALHHHKTDKKLFQERKQKGFPAHGSDK